MPPPNAHTPTAPTAWFGEAGWAKGRVLAAGVPHSAPPAPCLPLPWHSQAVGEVLHERAQAGEGEDGQDGKGQLEGEEDEGGMAARLGCWGGR